MDLMIIWGCLCLNCYDSFLVGQSVSRFLPLQSTLYILISKNSTFSMLPTGLFLPYANVHPLSAFSSTQARSIMLPSLHNPDPLLSQIIYILGSLHCNPPSKALHRHTHCLPFQIPFSYPCSLREKPGFEVGHFSCTSCVTFQAQHGISLFS